MLRGPSQLWRSSLSRIGTVYLIGLFYLYWILDFGTENQALAMLAIHITSAQ